MSQYSSFGITIWLPRRRRRNWGSIPFRVKRFSNHHGVQPALDPPSLLFSGYLELFSPGVKGPESEADIYLHLVLRLRMHAAVPPSSHTHMSLWCCFLIKHWDNFVIYILGG
jgi:hypothetical protein